MKSSIKRLELIKRSSKKVIKKAYTPIKPACIKDKLYESRSPSPESLFKLKNTIVMYESIKRSLTPIKKHESLPNIGIKTKVSQKLTPLHKEPSKISIKEYGVGNDYALAFSTTIKGLSNLKELNIRSNNINDDGTFSILSNINKSNIQILDISNNIIGENSIEALSSIISDFSSNIEKLSVENTKLSLSGLKTIITALQSNSSLQELNIANNKLGYGCGKYLKDLLTSTTSLKKIDLH